MDEILENLGKVQKMEVADELEEKGRSITSDGKAASELGTRRQRTNTRDGTGIRVHRPKQKSPNSRGDPAGMCGFR